MADEMELVRGCCYVGCYCPWCAHLKDSFCLRDILELNVKVHNRLCKVVLLIFLVLSGSLITFPVVSSKAVKNTSDVHPSSPNGLTQQLSPDPDSDCLVGTSQDCTCTALSKCKKCSRFELSRQVKYCFFTGYKQFVHCSSSKKYISCQFFSNSKEEMHFWIFELVVGCICILSLLVVRYRANLLQLQFTRRIQRQLNA